MTWTQAEAEIVARLSQRVGSSQTDANREVAKETGALPVYCSLGGCLLLCTDGVIRRYDAESGTVALETERKWILIGYVKAAQTFPELAGLMPKRPTTARMCSACNGIGRILGRLDCGVCSSLGWVDADGP